MSEEEIIDIVKYMKRALRGDTCNCYFTINQQYQAIEGILDLYTKEKEKNKKLEDKIKGMYDKSNKLIEVTNLYLNTSSKLERLENKIKMRIEQLESEFKEHEEKGLNGLIQKLDCGTRIEALKDLLKD